MLSLLLLLFLLVPQSSSTSLSSSTYRLYSRKYAEPKDNNLKYSYKFSANRRALNKPKYHRKRQNDSFVVVFVFVFIMNKTWRATTIQNPQNPYPFTYQVKLNQKPNRGEPLPPKPTTRKNENAHFQSWMKNSPLAKTKTAPTKIYRMQQQQRGEEKHTHTFSSDDEDGGNGGKWQWLEQPASQPASLDFKLRLRICDAVCMCESMHVSMYVDFVAYFSGKGEVAISSVYCIFKESKRNLINNISNKL